MGMWPSASVVSHSASWAAFHARGLADLFAPRGRPPKAAHRVKDVYQDVAARLSISPFGQFSQAPHICSIQVIFFTWLGEIINGHAPLSPQLFRPFLAHHGLQPRTLIRRRLVRVRLQLVQRRRSLERICPVPELFGRG